MIHLWLPGRPVPWQRTRGTARRWTAPEYRAWKEAAGWEIRREVRQPLETPVEAVIVVMTQGISVMVQPANYSPRLRPPGLAGDLDNYIKAVLDAGNRILWRDDRQLEALRARFGGDHDQ